MTEEDGKQDGKTSGQGQDPQGQEGQQKTSEEDKTKKTQNPGEDLKDRISDLSESQRLQKVKEDIDQQMQKADKKVRELEGVVDELEKQGITTTGEKKKSPEEEVQEKVDNDLKQFQT